MNKSYIIYVLDQHWEKIKETHDKNIVNNHTLDSSNKLTAFNFSRTSLQSSWNFKHIKMTESFKVWIHVRANFNEPESAFNKINIYNKLKMQ